MKYLLSCMRVIVMATDIALLAAAGFVLFYFWDKFPLNIAVLCLIVLMYKSWKKSGGFIAWNFQNMGG